MSQSTPPAQTCTLALTWCPPVGAARFDVYDTDKTGTLDKPQVAEVLKVRHRTVCHHGVFTDNTHIYLLWCCTPVHRI